jgi:hypothetical protein
VHVGAIRDLAREVDGQVVVIENIDPPFDLGGSGSVVTFSGPDGAGRRGFYPDRAGPS